MTDSCQTWIEQRCRLPGILGCGVRLPDRTCFGRSNSKGAPAETLDQAWNQVAEAMTLITQHHLTATRALWTFSDGQVHCAVRADGAVLCLITPPSTHAYSPALIEKIIGEFQEA